MMKEDHGAEGELPFCGNQYHYDIADLEKL